MKRIEVAAAAGAAWKATTIAAASRAGLMAPRTRSLRLAGAVAVVLGLMGVVSRVLISVGRSNASTAESRQQSAIPRHPGKTRGRRLARGDCGALPVPTTT